MVYPVYVFGSGVLREQAVDITADYPDLKGFIANMFDTMYDSDGLGLAAPQVGRAIRMFVIDPSPFADEEPELEGMKKTFINPEIYERFGEEWVFNEGCLSVPGIHEDVLRPESIRIKYLDENFKPQDETFSGMAARVIQHEYDHLDGKLFVDRLAPLRKQLIKSKLQKMSKGSYSAKYKTKIVIK